MAFDVAPEPVRRRGPRIPVFVVLAAGIAVVAFAVVTANPGGPAPAVPPRASAEAQARQAPTTIAAPTTAAGAPAAPAPFPSTRGRRLPANLECHAVSDAICDAVATASLAILPADAPPVQGIDAWASILCGDSLDCPPQRLAMSEPLGSAVVTFAGGGAQAWVNVVEPSPGTPGSEPADGPTAWIVRWQP